MKGQGPCLQRVDELYMKCAEWDLEVQLVWHPRSEQQQQYADTLSKFEDSSQWCLDDAVFASLWAEPCLQGSRPTVDVFADEFSTKVPGRFFARYWSPNALADLLVLLLDVGEHMQPYLPLLHRLVFHVLNVKLLSKPNHEVAVVLYGTKGTRHKLYDASDPLSYHHVTVLRPLQNLGSYLDLQSFAFAADPPRGAEGHGGEAAATCAAASPDHPAEAADAEAAAEVALLARVEAAGLAGGRDAAAEAAAVGRAARVFGPPGPKSDWADGLVVALDLLASALDERFERDKKEAGKLGQLRVLLVSNLVGESEPFDEDFRNTLVETCTNKRILLEVAALDHYVPQVAAAGAGAPTAEVADVDGGVSCVGGGKGTALLAAEGEDTLALLPPPLAASRRRNLEQLHLLKAEMAPAAFRYGTRCFRNSQVKLYKKIRRTIVDEWKTILDPKRGGGEGEQGGGGDGPGGGGGGGNGGGGGDGDGGGDGGGGGPGGGTDPGFVREVEYEDPTTGQKFTRDDFIVKGFSYGKQAVPIAQYTDEQAHAMDEQMRKFREKDFSLLGFVNAGSVPHHRLIDEPHVVLGDSPSSAAVIAALALVLKERGQAGVVRFLIRKESPQLGLLTPHLSNSPDVPHALLLSPLPFAEDIRTYTFSTFRNEQEARELPRLLAEARGEEPPPSPPPAAAVAADPLTQGVLLAGGSSSNGSSSNGLLGGLGAATTAPEPGLRFERLQPDDEQQDAALALVRGLDLGPSPLLGIGGGCATREPHPEALAPEATANPVLQRVYTLVTSRALDPTAQLPDPEGDPLVELVLQPHGRYWPPGAREALRRAEEKLRTRDRVPGSPRASKRARLEQEGGGQGAEDAAAAAGQLSESAAAAPVTVLFDPTAAGGTAAARVGRVAELSAVEDFTAMMAQGRDSAMEAVRQMQELVQVLVGRSIGDQLYGKALKCLEALRAGCTATGRAGAFNRFLQGFVEWCRSEDRGAFVSEMATQGISLITAEDLTRHRPPAGGGGSGGSSGGGDAALFEDDGGAVAPWEARQFLERHSRPAEEAVEATLPTVVQDEEFEDMD
ncbi:hypothetical protein VOLCADRAFT_118635 [Volvox carteri f. nagariensis]|uniref:Ku domain-containing protein n=1 Tax=Volvox carteri f. nagariensis TaxID=3068 RepID=D8U689_VOLCA|nr:uncharacterized protein VOLCADRAFT_118635 [Volvox carteri f. nagariensis]EFJ44811.1 hypothetical protein VOLCADRAFT_118635 [Volvox carteri f. nagariensis]|eukprot:XP_002954094.1 hypothetical protein VOLCADRAFT_118635 [Volvox carteri f. nagariensis]